MWILYSFASAFFTGLNAIFTKISIKNTDCDIAIAIKIFIVFIFSSFFVFLSGSYIYLSTISIKTIIFLILSGITTCLYWICYFKAMKYGHVNKVIPIDKTSTIITMFLAFLFLKEVISFNKILSIIFISIGTYLMIEKSSNEKNKNNKWIIYAVCAAIFASLTVILGKIGINNIPSNLGTTIRTFVVLIMSCLIVIITNKQKYVKKIKKNNLTFIILSGIATCFAWQFYYEALKLGEASIVCPIDKLSIIITISFSYFILKEKLSLKSLLGLILIVLGTLLLIF